MSCVNFSSDRFNKLDSSIYLFGGYLTLPADVYFSGDFTISVWLKKMNTVPNGSPVLDIGN